jgi:hypothetical protein
LKRERESRREGEWREEGEQIGQEECYASEAKDYYFSMTNALKNWVFLKKVLSTFLSPV